MLAATGADSRQRASIEVLEVRRVTNCGAVRAFVKLRLGGLIVDGVKVIAQEGQRPWIAQQPARPNADGGKGRGWFPLIKATPELMAKIKAAVLAAFEREATS